MLSEHGPLCQGHAAPAVLGGESGIRSPGKPIKIVEYAQERHASTPPGYASGGLAIRFGERRPQPPCEACMFFMITSEVFRSSSAGLNCTSSVPGSLLIPTCPGAR